MSFYARGRSARAGAGAGHETCAALHMQSALSPGGPEAALLGQLAWVLFIGAALIFVFVMALAAVAVFSRPRAIDGERWIVGGGLVFPVTVLSVLLVYAYRTGASIADVGVPGALQIEVIGRLWWWEVRYRNPDGSQTVLANELRVPVGRPVELFLTSDDVIHSFWLPALAGKLDMIPGHVNRLVFSADRPGIHRGQCAEYCGRQHAFMAFYVIAEDPADFERWLARESRPAVPPSEPFLREGLEAFMRGGCGTCHTIRGTQADGRLGPDLTHIGSRRSLGAGVLDNHVGTIAGWIADTQTIKPGSLMPETRVFSGRELRAVAAYLDSLE